MKRPNFMCLGAPKCGTTTLYDILKQHPDIFLTSFKEPHFFDIDKNYQEGYQWYLSEYYHKVGNQQIIGEFTPSYFTVPKVSKRIKKDIGKDIKFILILRNPVERAYSLYLHAKRDLKENLSFEEGLLEEEDRLKKFIKNGDDISYGKFSYINGGLYYKHLINFLQDFDQSQFKFFIFEEEFMNDRQKMLNEIYDFLNIEPIDVDIDIKSNAAADARFPKIKSFLNEKSRFKSYSKSLIKSKKVRSKIINYLQKLSNKKVIKQEINHEFKMKILNKYFLDDIQKLEKLIDRDLSVWYRDI